MTMCGYRIGFLHIFDLNTLYVTVIIAVAFHTHYVQKICGMLVHVYGCNMWQIGFSFIFILLVVLRSRCYLCYQFGSAHFIPYPITLMTVVFCSLFYLSIVTRYMTRKTDGFASYFSQDSGRETADIASYLSPDSQSCRSI